MTGGVTAALDARFEANQRPHVHTSGPLELRGPLGASSFYYLRNVTAGVFAGDAYRTTVRCEPGAEARIESSSATKVYSMPSGSADVSVELCAEPSSRLVWGPHATILHTDAALRQTTRVNVQPGAVVLMAETLVMGRIAAGQRFDFRSYETSFEVWGGADDVLYREAYRLEPGPDLEAAMGDLGVLTCVYALGAVDDGAGEQLDALCTTRALTGWSALPNRCGLVVKALTASMSEGTAIARECLAVFSEVGSPSHPHTLQPA